MESAKGWAPALPTSEELREAEQRKAPYVGNDQEGPSRLRANTYVLPGKRWAGFSYVAPPPVIDMRSWKFETYGLVNNPMSLTYAEFRELPAVTTRQDHTCVDHVTTPGHEFEGVDFRTIVDLTEPESDCEWILAECDGGYTMVHPVSRPMTLIYKRNGRPLEPANGYPLRLWAPGEWGWKNPKWVRRIKFCEEREVDYWLGWYLLRGMDPEVLDAGYDTDIGSELDPQVVADFNFFTYAEITRDRRRQLHLLGARPWGIAQHRAPLYIGDENWNNDNYKYTLG
jgi:DMSO/TMAO reductase YedYZ molybdopterin-dependent catalytic subunit